MTSPKFHTWIDPKAIHVERVSAPAGGLNIGYPPSVIKITHLPTRTSIIVGGPGSDSKKLATAKRLMSITIRSLNK